jgi:S1-C subfamily serine protease
MLVGALLMVGLAAYAATRVFRPATTPAAGALLPASSSSSAPASVSPAPAVETEAHAPAAEETITLDAPMTPPADAPAVGVAPAAAPPSLEDVIGAAIPAVVSIETRDGRGSGFFVNPGVIITNNHVVAGNISVTVRLPSGSSVPGRVERKSSDFDLAIVRVDGLPATQPMLQLGSAADVRVGQEVIAIGLAMGQFQGTVTRGIISALRRAGPASGVLLLQTDAAINPGNSGGPLIDRSGKVVGITTLKVTGIAESLGFAVAADHALSFLAGGSAQAPAIAANAPSSAPLAPAFSPRSEADVKREQGLQVFDQSVRAIATRAAQVDAYWMQIKRECGGRVSGAYTREWFAIWDNRLSITSSDPGCLSALNTVRQTAAQVRSVMVNLHEDARRAGVYPGDLRQTRSKHQLDWAGWDR